MRVEHNGWARPVNLAIVNLPENSDEQTAATIERMRELAIADARDASVESIARQLPSFSDRAYVDAVFWFVRRRVRFLRDSAIAPNIGRRGDLIEILIRPIDLLVMPVAVGDCDDFSMLVAALLLNRGIACSFVTVAANEQDCSRYSHVYVVAHLAGDDVAIDASHGSAPGWEVRSSCGKRRLWRVDRMGLGLVYTGDAESTGGGGGSWLTLVSQGLDIVKGRYGTPENTFIRRPDGTVVSRGSQNTAPVGAPIDQRSETIVRSESTPWLTTGGSAIAVIAALVLLALILMAMAKNK